MTATLFDEYCAKENIEPNSVACPIAYKAWAAARDYFRSHPSGELQSLDTAPKNATYILALATDRYRNRFWLVVHWAQGGGEEQPPFRGWFYHCGDGYSEIQPQYILGWMPLPEVPR